MTIKELDICQVEIVGPSDQIELEGMIQELGQLDDGFWIIVLDEVAEELLSWVGRCGGQKGNWFIVFILRLLVLEFCGKEFDA